MASFREGRAYKSWSKYFCTLRTLNISVGSHHWRHFQHSQNSWKWKMSGQFRIKKCPFKSSLTCYYVNLRQQLLEHGTDSIWKCYCFIKITGTLKNTCFCTKILVLKRFCKISVFTNVRGTKFGRQILNFKFLVAKNMQGYIWKAEFEKQNL